MNHVIFIGGATASGKTSIIKELEKTNSISRYKIKWALKEAAFRKNLSLEYIGDDYPSLIYSAKDILINEIIPKENFLIIDTHYAIQLNLNYSLSKKEFYVENINEPYIAGIEPFVLKELAKTIDSISFIFIQAPIDDILSRRLIRSKSFLPYRSLISHSIIKEQKAEKEFFFNSVSLVNYEREKYNLSSVKTFIINNQNNTFKNQIGLLKKFIFTI